MTTSTERTEKFQITPEAAEIYEARFVPAIFAEWADHLVDAADITPGDKVLDVGCGTGIVARVAADRTGPDGAVRGLDLNPAMLNVARRIRPDVGWHQGDANSLPFPDDSFDAVLCQMVLMFLPDRVAALSQMRRVARESGCVGLVVPASVGDQPAYGPFIDIAVRHAGPEAASLLGTYWSCGDLTELAGLLDAARLEIVSKRTRTGTAHFGSIDDLVATEVHGSPLSERITDVTYQAILDDSRETLSQYVTATGVEIPLVGHVLVARPA